MRNLLKIFCSSVSLVMFATAFSSCGNDDTPKIVIGNDFYYWESTAESTYGDAMKNYGEFKKLEDKTEHNLMHIFGEDRHYVWLRHEFKIPAQFRNQPLGMVIPHLRFAAQVYCNGTFISQYGAFPPNEQSTLFKAHFFSFPLDVLEQYETNTVMIKVFIQGDSGISSHAFIQPARFAYPAFERMNFNTTRIYMLLFGIMFITFILYLCFYFNIPAFKEFRDFALLNLFTSFFMVYFFATELPLYTSGAISHLALAKYAFCIPGYCIVYFTYLFAANYFGVKTPLPLRIMRHSIIAVQVVLTIVAPDYDFLIKISPPMMTMVFLQIAGGTVEFFMRLWNRDTRRKAVQVLLGFSPFIAGVCVDVILRIYDSTQSFTYSMLFGWQGAIVVFLIMLAIRFTRIYRSNELLKNHLQEEVESRTHELKEANAELSVLNEQLEKDKHRSDMDLEMASLVQRNFFPQPNKHFKGWEIAICYAPQAKVSGDLYDYYSYNDILNGLSLFDVSGHGLSASLVTMLSKNIIARMFQKGFRNNDEIEKILTKINHTIIYEKGDIDNYMTGILCRFKNIGNGEQCMVELGNAGHPYPLMYSKIEDEVSELRGTDGKKHYGAIGMKGIMVSFATSEFTMSSGDILVCYTDGITEATNQKMEQFGAERIKAIIKKHNDKPSDELLKKIMEALFKFTKTKPLDDDITLIIAKRTDMDEFVSDDEHEEEFEDGLEELEDAD